MATPFIDLIKQKADNLDAIPDKFLTGVKRSEKQILDGVLDLISKMELNKNGTFKASVKNIEIASQVNEQIKRVMLQSEYATALTEFANGFNLQANLTQTYFLKALQVDVPAIAKTLVETAKRNAVDLLINRANDSQFLSPLRDIIEQSVVNNSTYAETLKSVREFITGSDQFDSRLMSYSRQVALDTFSIADASVVATYSNEYEFEWFQYVGGTMKTTRPFCLERDGNYYHRKEIEAWGDGKKTTGLALPSAGEWGGRIDGTSASTIFSYRGGYACRHLIMPVSVFSVTREDILRAMAQGFYDPSQTVRDEFGLE
jgi:hypothetical protein